MLKTIPNVHATLASFDTKEERGRVKTACGIFASLNASRLRRARLASRNDDRVHKLDERIVPGVQLLVDIESDSTGKARVTTVHGLSDRRLELTDDSLAMGTVTWIPNKSFGFIKVLGLYDENHELKAFGGMYEDVFVHISEVHKDLVECARVPGTRVVFRVISCQNQAKFQAKIIDLYK